MEDSGSGKEKLRETVSYQQFKKYTDGFFGPVGVFSVLKQCRDFYDGVQYLPTANSRSPKPVFNICREAVDRKSAKICGTDYHVSFVSDMENSDLKELDDFYDYQREEMDDNVFNYRLARRAYIDGIGIAITSYDEDTVGTKGLFRGFTKRAIIPFERFFCANPRQEDLQEQRYLGYYINMEIGAAKELIECSGKEREEKEKLLVPEDFYDIQGKYEPSSIDSESIRVYFRYFRIDGEVYFSASTKYAELFDSPHPLNPSISEAKIRKAMDEFKSKEESESDSGIEERDTEIRDIKTDQAKYTMPTKAKKQSDSEYSEIKRKFSRYPFSCFRPSPIDGTILGQSEVFMLIPNQKTINYHYLLSILITQNHAMPKILVKPGAMEGQEYDTSPNQMIEDRSDISKNGGGWGITRLTSGDAVNSNLIAMGESFMEDTRRIYGFNNIEAKQLSGDVSGYMYQQAVKQMNLTLEQPQKQFWMYVKDNARTDIMYYQHYISSAKFFYRRSESEIELNDTDRRMSQNLIDSGKADGIKPGTTLEKAEPVETKEIGEGFFDHEFNVSMSVEQGISGSEITESQHFNQIWSYIASGNVDSDTIRMLVNGDPAISEKIRGRLIAELDKKERGELAQKDAAIQTLQTQNQELVNRLNASGVLINLQNKKSKAQEKAAGDQNALASAIIKQQSASYKQGQTSDSSQQDALSETKSNSARGITSAEAGAVGAK